MYDFIYQLLILCISLGFGTKGVFKLQIKDHDCYLLSASCVLTILHISSH